MMSSINLIFEGFEMERGAKVKTLSLTGEVGV
jgi:hypothetical protein